MKNLSDKETVLSSINDEKNMCRVYGSFVSVVDNEDLRNDACKIFEETASLAGKFREEMINRSWSEQVHASTERKNAVLREFSHLNFSD